MGFLDHSTNNIIVDAVLTDTGRRLLSANTGDFRIVQFALSDEEVDYGIITQFGRNVGQEKIEKNTPVLEAPTRSNLGQKYRLLSVSNTYLDHLPELKIENITGGVNANPTSGLVELKKSTNNQDFATVTFIVKPSIGASVEEELRDEFFFVEVNNIFLNIPSADVSLINLDNTVVYRIGTSTISGVTTLEFRVQTKSFSNSQFNTYKIATSNTSSDFVKLFVKVTGATSGLTKHVEVRVKI